MRELILVREHILVRELILVRECILELILVREQILRENILVATAPANAGARSVGGGGGV